MHNNSKELCVYIQIYTLIDAVCSLFDTDRKGIKREQQ